MRCSICRKVNCWTSRQQKVSSTVRRAWHALRDAPSRRSLIFSITSKCFTTGVVATPNSATTRRFSSCKTGSRLSLIGKWWFDATPVEDVRQGEAHLSATAISKHVCHARQRLLSRSPQRLQQLSTHLLARRNNHRCQRTPERVLHLQTHDDPMRHTTITALGRSELESSSGLAGARSAGSLNERHCWRAAPPRGTRKAVQNRS